MSSTDSSPPADGLNRLLAELVEIDNLLEDRGPKEDETDDEVTDEELQLAAAIGAEGRFAIEIAEVIDDLLALDEKVSGELRERLVAAAGRALSENRLRSGRLEPLLRRDRLQRDISFESLIDQMTDHVPDEVASREIGAAELEEVERGLTTFESLGAPLVAEWIQTVATEGNLALRALALSTPELAGAGFGASNPRRRAKAVNFVREVAELLGVEPPSL